MEHKAARLLEYGYHARTVWPFEQAMVYEGAKKFGLTRIQKVCLRVLRYLKTNPEILTLDKKKILPGGCDPQLWTLAAKDYFRRNV